MQNNVHSPRWSTKAVDRSMLFVALANVLFAVGIGLHFGQLQTALAVGLPIAAIAAVSYALLRGRMAAALLLTTCIAALVALQIHLSYGMIEFHFNVFISIGLLLAYRDWRPIVFMGSLFILHHLAFDRLLQQGFGTYCMSAPALGRVMLHAGFVIVQCAYLSRVAISMRHQIEAAQELEMLVQAMGNEGAIRLEFKSLQLKTRIGQRLQQALTRMTHAVQEVRHVSNQLGQTADMAASSGTELMDRTVNTANGLREAAMSLEQIGIIVQSSTEAAQEAKGLSDSAAAVANRGGELVSDVVRSIHAMGTASRKITEIISVIDGIAFQTNILALNAAVEAARAGEQGRGFAVVAGEVRNLAQRTTTAAKEIKALIDNSVTTAEEGTKLVSGAGDTMNQLVASVQDVGKLFQSMSADSNEHVHGLKTVNATMGELSEMTHQNVSVAERASQTAVDLDEQAKRLNEVLMAFHLDDQAQPSAPKDTVTARKDVAVRQPRTSGPRSSGTNGIEFF